MHASYSLAQSAKVDVEEARRFLISNTQVQRHRLVTPRGPLDKKAG